MSIEIACAVQLARVAGRVLVHVRLLAALLAIFKLATRSCVLEALSCTVLDYDTYGRTYDPDTNNGLASGTKKEHALTAYGYTGMRKRDSAGTTNHHARDYNAASRMWLQTDQYMNPWRDVALSLDPMNRNRSAYAGGNPISNVDLDGHKICVFGICTTIDEKIAAGVDRVTNAVRVATGGQPQRVTRRSILPTGSLGPISVTTPSVVDLSSQLDPYPGVSNDDMANAHMDAGHALEGAEAIFRGAGAIYAGRAWDSARHVNYGKTARRAGGLMGRANILNRLASGAGWAGIGYTVGSSCVTAGSTAGCTIRGPATVGGGAIGFHAAARAAAPSCSRLANPRNASLCFVGVTATGAFVGGETADRMIGMMSLNSAADAAATVSVNNSACDGGDFMACFEKGWAIGTAIND